MRWARTMSIVVAGVSSLRMWTVQPRLPARVASHFDATGAADGWMSPGSLLGFHVALLALMLAVFAILPGLTRRLPVTVVNLPHRDHWLAPERRADTFARLEAWMATLGLVVVSAIALLQEMVVQANLPGGDGRLPVRVLVVLLGALIGASAVWTVAFVRTWRVPAR